MLGSAIWYFISDCHVYPPRLITYQLSWLRSTLIPNAHTAVTGLTYTPRLYDPAMSTTSTKVDFEDFVQRYSDLSYASECSIDYFSRLQSLTFIIL